MVHPHREVLPPKSRFGFLADDHSLLLVDCHSQLPPVLNCDPSETLAGEKGTACVPKGGSDPRLTWAAESRKSGVAPAPFDFFSTAAFASAATLSLCRSKDFHLAR